MARVVWWRMWSFRLVEHVVYQVFDLTVILTMSRLGCTVDIHVISRVLIAILVAVERFIFHLHTVAFKLQHIAIGVKSDRLASFAFEDATRAQSTRAM